MFEFIRKHNKFFNGLLMLFIIPSFMLGGYAAYESINKSQGVATVDGQAITQQEWDEAHRYEVAQMQAKQPDADSAMLNAPYVRYATLERILEQRLITSAIKKFRLQASDQSVAQTLLQIPEIAALRGADGKIDEEKYRQLLRDNNRTPEEFEAFIRTQLSQQQLLQGLNASVGWQPAVLSELSLKPILERREIQLVSFNPADYASKVTVEQSALRDWYQQHNKLYTVAEQAQIEYLVLDVTSLQTRHPYSDKDLQDWYQRNGARHYGQPEARRASHILIQVDEAADKTTLETARAKALALLQLVKANPSNFAEIAKKNSQDPGSATQGGDLGFFEREKMVKPFADATFALKKGQISDLVQSKFGFHIIALTDIKEANIPAFETVKDKAVEEYQREQTKLHFANDARALSEELGKNPLSLKAVAEKLGLPLRTADVSAQPALGQQGVLADPRFLKALFTPASLDKKQVTEAITLAPNLLVAGQVQTHTPAHTKPYDEVKAQVEQDYVQAKAAELAQAAGQAQLKEWQSSPTQAVFTAPVVVSKVQPSGQPLAVVNAALLADRAKLPALVGVKLDAQGYAIVRVNKVLEADATTAAIQAQQLPIVLRALSQAQTQAYLDTMRNAFEVKINVPQPEVPKQLGVGQ